MAPYPPTKSWADRKIPDIVVQRWLQAGRQQAVGAGEGGPEPPEHLEVLWLDRRCCWRATCLHGWMWKWRLLPQDKEAPLGEADEGCRGSKPVSLLFQLWVTFTVWVTPSLGQK